MSAFNCVHKVNVMNNVCAECEALFDKYPNALDNTGWDVVTKEDGTTDYKPHVPTECIHLIPVEGDCATCDKFFDIVDGGGIPTDEDLQLLDKYGQFTVNKPKLIVKGQERKMGKPQLIMSSEEEQAMNRRQAAFAAVKRKNESI